MMQNAEEIARTELIFALKQGDAHMGFDDVLANFPLEHINTRPPNTGYTFWHLLEHLRFCQWDILDYVQNANYKAAKFLEGYWPQPDEMADEARWHQTIVAFKADLEAMVALIRDEHYDLFTAPPQVWKPHHTPYRCFMVIADHNAYHLGEIAILWQVLGLWPVGRVDGWNNVDTL